MTKFRVQVFTLLGVIMLIYMTLNIHNVRISMETKFTGGDKHTNIEKTIRQLASSTEDEVDFVLRYLQNDTTRPNPFQDIASLKRIGQFFKSNVENSTSSISSDSVKIKTENITSVRGLGHEEDCYFHDRLEKDGLPIIHSMFIDHVENRVVMIGVKREEVTEVWESEIFICDFNQNILNDKNATGKTLQSHVRHRSSDDINIQLLTMSDPIINDFQKVGQTHQGVLVITCPVPYPLQNETSLKINILKQSDPDVAYSGLEICGNNKPGKYKLAMCTMMKHMDRFVPDWLEYHKNLGVEHIYIYDNAKNSVLAKWVQKYLLGGFLTIIPWSHKVSKDKTYLETQIASENDCIWRHKHDVEWMIKIDVDEFLQPMDPNRHLLPNYLNESFSSLGSLKLQNWFFCPPPRNSSDYRVDTLKAKTIFERNTYRSYEPTELNRGRDKTIVRPDNVHYFKIHIVKWGAPSVTLSPNSEIRMVHYRGDNPLHRGFCPKRLVKDTSMLDLWRTFN